MSPSRITVVARATGTTPALALLQRKCACGNGASDLTGECSDCAREKTLGVQTKLAVGARDDPLEREADRIADHVMGVVPAPTAVDAGRAAPAAPLVRRATPITTGAVGPTTPSGEAPAIVGEVLSAPGQPLDTATRQFMEPRFGHDFDHVRVHTDPRAAASAAAVVSRAYTVNRDLVFAAGEYRPETQNGRWLLAHELAHTLQQGAATRLRRDDPDDYDGGGASAAGVAGAALTGAAAGAALAGGAAGSAAGAAAFAGAAGGAAGAAGARPAQSGGGSGGGSAAPTPSVDSWTVRTSGATQADNCCAICPVNLGVDVDPAKLKNGIELKAKLNNHAAGYSYDIKRTLEKKTWRRNGGSDPWAMYSSKPAGSDDDSHDSDECLTPKADGAKHKIYSEDRPGFASVSGSYTDYVQMINFIESVRITDSAGTSSDDPRTQKWHSTMWVTKGASGTWSVNTANSEIGSGHLAKLEP